MNGHIDAAVSSFTSADDYVFFAEELVRDACTQEVNPSASDSGNSGSSASGNNGHKGNKGNSPNRMREDHNPPAPEPLPARPPPPLRPGR